MARKVEVRLIDDLDQSVAAETVHFGLDGKDYEIDLSGKNALQLRTALDKYLQVATRVTTTRTTRAKAQAANGSPGPGLNDAIRAWARDNGIEVAPRGRISASVVEQYNNRHTMSQAAESTKPRGKKTLQGAGRA